MCTRVPGFIYNGLIRIALQHSSGGSGVGGCGGFRPLSITSIIFDVFILYIYIHSIKIAWTHACELMFKSTQPPIPKAIEQYASMSMRTCHSACMFIHMSILLRHPHVSHVDSMPATSQGFPLPYTPFTLIVPPPFYLFLFFFFPFCFWFLVTCWFGKSFFAWGFFSSINFSI